PTTAEHVRADLRGRIDLIVDGGPTSVGVESTIVGCLDGGPGLLRPGRDSPAAIGELLRRNPPAPATEGGGAPPAPRPPRRPRAPRARLRLDADSVRPGEALLAFGQTLPPGAEAAVATRNLSPAADLVEAAANLFLHLRTLDSTGATTIAVMPVPPTGLGEAI